MTLGVVADLVNNLPLKASRQDWLASQRDRQPYSCAPHCQPKQVRPSLFMACATLHRLGRAKQTRMPAPWVALTFPDLDAPVHMIAWRSSGNLLVHPIPRCAGLDHDSDHFLLRSTALQAKC
jgi:hypothetical protein